MLDKPGLWVCRVDLDPQSVKSSSDQRGGLRQSEKIPAAKNTETTEEVSVCEKETVFSVFCLLGKKNEVKLNITSKISAKNIKTEQFV